jgi:hypothetical protein
MPELPKTDSVYLLPAATGFEAREQAKRVPIVSDPAGTSAKRRTKPGT